MSRDATDGNNLSVLNRHMIEGNHKFVARSVGAACLIACLTLLHWQAAFAASCDEGPQQATAANAKGQTTMPITAFHRSETGWATYETMIANEIRTDCPAKTPGFAAALAHWQKAKKLPSTGILDNRTFKALKLAWDLRRPWVLASRRQCPAAADERELVRAKPDEVYGGKTIQLRADALAAYRKMADAAHRAGLIPPKSGLFVIFSGYRAPDTDAARCTKENNCRSGARATCSAHRTGLALDIDLGAAPGFRLDSSADQNRLFLSRTKLYRWMVKNAPKFGFVNYAFEPWHWEFTAAPGKPGTKRG